MQTKARPNGLVIGETLFDIVKGLEEYKFVSSSERLIGVKGDYGVYHVDHKEKRSIINCITCLVRANITLIKALVPSLRRASDRAI